MKITKTDAISPADKSKIIDFLDSHPVGVLATVDSDGNPNASTIYFAVNKNLDITFTTKRDTRKHQNIERHNKVMLVVYDAESQSAAQISGPVTEEKNAEVASAIYHGTLRAAKQTGEDNVPPIAKIAAGPYIAYTLKPEAISMSEYGWGDSFTNAMEHAGELAPKQSNEDPA